MVEWTSDIWTLVRNGVHLAIDTEFDGSDTLTVQAALREPGGKVLMQLYHSPELISPRGFKVEGFLHGLYRQFLKDFSRRPAKKLSVDLSPGRMIIDLLKLERAATVLCSQGFRRLKDRSLKPSNATWDDRCARWQVPAIRVTLVGHFLPADFARAFGVQFYNDVLDRTADGPKIEISSNRRLAFVGRRRTFDDYEPIVEFIELADGQLFAIRLATVDTNLTFGPTRLDHLSQVLLGVGKGNVFSEDELKNMRTTFAKRPNEAFGYGLRDAVLTLLVYERMVELDRSIYESLRIPSTFVQPMAGTIGGRVGAMLYADIRKFAGPSKTLSSERELKALMREGGRSRFRKTHEGSRFGEQAGATHGGLLYSRTPTRLWQEAPGMFRDVDLHSCYNTLLGQLNLYLGRPVIWEPGDSPMTLADAVAFLKQHAPDDGWMVWASGPISSMPNTLVRSTLDAATTEKYRSQRSRPIDEGSAKFRSQIFSEEIQFGVFTAAVWEIIDLFPDSMRREYANLRVESIVFYPNDFIAETPAEFDKLCGRLRDEFAPWRADLRIGERTIVETIKLDHRYVCLRYPIGEMAQNIERLRQAERREHGKDSGQALLWKLQANTMCGVLASPQMLTNNVVAANQLTSRARVAAYMLLMALNGGQVITDGTWYRVDRVPRSTLSECLRRYPDYPLRQADEDSGIKFRDPTEIPSNDASFNRWLRTQLKRFFEIDETQLKRLLIHTVEHKTTGETGARGFDAIAAVGSGDHLKFVQSPQGWTAAQVCLRGFDRHNRQPLVDWIRDTFSTDSMETLPPITEECELLKYDAAIKKVEHALKNPKIDKVMLPLGLENRKAKAFTAIQLSSFVFKTARQRKAALRQLKKLVTSQQGTLDILALRRGHKDRGRGSLSSIAVRVYAHIQAGRSDLSKALNLRRERLSASQIELLEEQREDREERRRTAERRLLRLMRPQLLKEGRVLTGRLVQRPSVDVLQHLAAVE